MARRKTLYFAPKGRAVRVNPVQDWTGESGLSAVFYVGLVSRDKEERFSPKYVRELFLQFRREQDADIGASFIFQLGLYRDSAGRDIREPSLQIAVIHLPYTGETGRNFQKNMLKLGERLKEALNQETVILEFREKNQVKKVFGIADEGVPVEDIPYIFEEAAIGPR